jgi:predicted N-formylglutamate amidohydrolase
VALRIARLQTPAIIAGYSRLVIDCNRYPSPWDPASIALVSDRTAVPGNLDLSAAARGACIDALFVSLRFAVLLR